MKNSKDPWKERTHSLKMQLKRVSSFQKTLKQRQYSLPSKCKNSHIPSISSDNYQILWYTSTKTSPWYVIKATNTDTQKQDADENTFVKTAAMKTTQLTKQLDAQMNLSTETVEKDTWQEVTTVKLEKRKSNEKNANWQQSGKTKSSSSPSGRRWVSKINPSIKPCKFQM